MKVEDTISDMSRYGDVTIFTTSKGSFYGARFIQEVSTNKTFRVDTFGCQSISEALGMINQYFYIPAPPRVPDGAIFLGDKVFGEIQKLFAQENLSITIDNRRWSVSMSYERKSRDTQATKPGIEFIYEEFEKADDFSELMKKIFCRFKIPAEGIVLGPVGMSHRLSG